MLTLKGGRRPVKILLTGGSGLVGRTLAPLMRGKHKIVHLETRAPGDGLPFIQGDLRDAKAVEEACHGVDTVIHIAALHGKAWMEAGDEAGFDVNVTGTKNILEAAIKQRVKRVVFTSSIWAAGHLPKKADYLPIDEKLDREPLEMYGLTKKLGEQMCRYYSVQYGLSTICLRPGGIQPADDSDTIRWGLLFQAVDVRDVAQAHALAAESGEGIQHEVFNITADSPLAEIDLRVYQQDCIATLEKLYPGISRFMNDQQKESLPGQEWYTINKAKQMLGYKPQYNFKI